MYFTNKDVRERLVDVVREFNATDLDNESSVHYLLGYMRASIEDTIQVIDRIEQDKKYEKYRQQEEADFNSHLGRF